MLHRIFIAINLPEKIKKELSNFERDFSNIPGRWVKPENLHITLLFLGSIKTENLPKIFETLNSVVSSFSKFKIELEKISFFPPKSFPPRMVWVFIKKSEILEKLQKELEKKMIKSQIPFQKEEKEFAPHITLARIKKFEFRRLELEELPKIDEEINLSFEAQSIDVMESHLKRKGPEYTLLKAFPLF